MADVVSLSEAWPCSGCGRQLPRTIEFYHRDSMGRHGLARKCRDCRCTAERARYAQSAPTILQRVRERRAERAAYFETQPQWQAV
jgi:hypothetical protein